LNLYAVPRQKSVDRFKDQVRSLTRRNAPVRLRDVIEVINPVIRGWGNYYRKARHLCRPQWLDLLQELAPRATRVGVVYAPENPSMKSLKWLSLIPDRCLEGERFLGDLDHLARLLKEHAELTDDLLRLGSRPLPGSLRELYYRRAACDGGGRGNLRSAGVDCQSIPTRPR
jgi:Group II intron, maturase-specific domain